MKKVCFMHHMKLWSYMLLASTMLSAKNSDCDTECLKTNSFTTYGDFLYWKSNVTSFPFATTTSFPTQTVFNTTREQVSFGYKPGFRVGGTYKHKDCDYTLSLNYTQFKQSGSKRITTQANQLINRVWGTAAMDNNPLTASATMSNKLQTVDVSIGRDFLDDCALSMWYEVGFKWARPSIKMDVLYDGFFQETTPRTSNVFLSNTSQNLGLVNRFVINYDTACYGIGIYSNGEFALMRSNFNVSQEEIVRGGPGPRNLKDNQFLQSVTVNAVLEAGVSWCRSFCDNAFGLALNAGYAFNYWPNQLLTYKYALNTTAESVVNLVNAPSDLSFRGFTLGGSISF